MSSNFFSIGSSLHGGEVFYQSKDDQQKWFFRVDFESRPVKLFVDRYFTGLISGLSYKLPEENRKVVISSLVAKLENEGYQVEVVG